MKVKVNQGRVLTMNEAIEGRRALQSACDFRNSVLHMVTNCSLPNVGEGAIATFIRRGRCSSAAMDSKTMKITTPILAAGLAATFAMAIQPALAQYQGPQYPSQRYPGQQYPQSQYQYQDSGGELGDPYRAGYRAGYWAARRNMRYDDRPYDQDGSRERSDEPTDHGQR